MIKARGLCREELSRGIVQALDSSEDRSAQEAEGAQHAAVKQLFNPALRTLLVAERAGQQLSGLG